ncbi:MAG TPA: dephospho-CoA kinase [Verrucomicrobiales bacterium]|jgi:dephospho-CoA kinase|nr:dephospho-CoA kinase [Verrucomicrobiales bacterium]|tara:strand:- start:80 stop:682 length:603 start_codon:yes stop_codon:yes gene_type:complete
MRVLALSGGIATGKSTAGKMINRLMPTSAFFDCDESVRCLLKAQEVLEEISETLGQSVIKMDGSLDRATLRKLVFENENSREKLETILHPKVRKECLEKLNFYSKTTPTTLFVADVPLLFESGFDFGQELNLVVATSQATQRTRLKARSHFEDRMISSILKAQLPIMEKVARADVVFWNEGSLSIMESQLARFLKSLSIS